MSKTAEVFSKALSAAEAGLALVLARHEAAYDETVGAAQVALSVAIAKHDEVVDTAQAKLNANHAAEHGRTAALIEKATKDFDAAMAREVGAPANVRVENVHGGLRLMEGRRSVATATPVHGEHWRVTYPDGQVTVVGSMATARALLWGVMADMATAVA